ncbi:hypothetical protein KGA66_24475 [Actinocrinis puniceicyclus]|uniref:Exo-alpha-sialidase n=1 Tax=Actinocrinis puniceicyclus TaxID=977794 RepID=A0A8J7WPM9_9ACTN|nr:hypothetical protein [Actinocrinis puniceicyclus]MBS2966223.1 hypothetical protein [Actinocrinis puniceicyclus]
MRDPRHRLTVPLLSALAVIAASAVAVSGPPAAASSSALDPGVGVVPQGLQSNTQFAASYTAHHVTNTTATTTQTSCYRPEVSYFTSLGPNDGYSGMSSCPGATTGEDIGTTPYATQSGSNPGYPASGPMLVKDHAESDLRVDPTDPQHLIGSSKWIVSAEGYNHLLGFYESFDGGKTWSVSGHIPGFEGWTDNTDPVGAFDSYGDYYSLTLNYQFFYNADGSHNYSVGTSREPNPAEPSEVIAMAVRPHGATTATQWTTTVGGHPDVLASYDSLGNSADKQWLTIDTNPGSAHFNRVYAMWVDFHYLTPVPYVSYADALPGGQHTAWSKPQPLPVPPHTPTGATYLLPHVAADGTVYTTVTNSDPAHQYASDDIFVDASTDGGATWSTVGTPVPSVTPPPYTYANTTFRDGIEDTFTVGPNAVSGHYPLYVSYEDYSAGVDNVMLTASYDGGATWTGPIQVDDNAAAADEFQPNLTAAGDGTVSVAFYDRRLACPAAGTAEAKAAGLALDRVNSSYPGSLPPYSAANYCIDTAVQFYDASLRPLGNNIRLSAHAFDPQLNSPHPGSAGSATTFLGDYFGNITAATSGAAVDYTTSVTTYNDGTNPKNQQQQLIAQVAIP